MDDIVYDLFETTMRDGKGYSKNIGAYLGRKLAVEHMAKYANQKYDDLVKTNHTELEIKQYKDCVIIKCGDNSTSYEYVIREFKNDK